MSLLLPHISTDDVSLCPAYFQSSRHRWYPPTCLLTYSILGGKNVEDSVRASFWQVKQQKSPAQESSCTPSTCDAPDGTLPAPRAPSLSLPQCPLPSASLHKSHHRRCSLACTTCSSLSEVASSAQVGRFTGARDQQVFSRWRLYLAKWRIYLSIDSLVPL